MLHFFQSCCLEDEGQHRLSLHQDLPPALAAFALARKPPIVRSRCAASAAIGGFLASAKAAKAGGKFEKTKSTLPLCFQGGKGQEEMEHRMKRIAYIFLAEIVLGGMLVTLAGAQSEPLGDYARSIRKDDKKEAGKKYDNDNLPTRQDQHRGQAAASTGQRTPIPAPPLSLAPRRLRIRLQLPRPIPGPGHCQEGGQRRRGRKRSDQWKQKFADQKSKVDLLTRELDVAQREYRLRAAAFYADAGSTSAQPGFMGQRRRPIQTADRPESKKPSTMPRRRWTT